jgi:capsular polysaccharide biosynthesis protein
LNSNAIYSKKNNTVYYENWNDQNETQICDYSSKEIVNHNENKAIIKYKISTERLNKAIFLGCTFPSSYYHFLVELISRTAYLSQIPNSKNLPIIISNSILQYDSLTTISSIFLKDYKVIYLNNEYSYEVDDLWYITSPNSLVPNIKKGGKFEAKHSKIRPESILYLRHKCFEFLNFEPVKITTHSKIFIKRKANARTYNQDEIENSAKKYGFQSVYFEDLTFSEQLKTINNADYIIGATGAAWTNLIFAKNGGKGLIWAESNWENLSMFSTIASIVNFDLNYMIFNSKTNDYHENYILELDVFENNLKKLLYL